MDPISEQNELLRGIKDRLDQLVTLTAAVHIAGLNQTDSVAKLTQYGFTAKAIAEISGFPLKTVAPLVSRAKAGASKTKR